MKRAILQAMTPEERAARARELNRLAQARYRDRHRGTQNARRRELYALKKQANKTNAEETETERTGEGADSRFHRPIL